MGSRLAGLVLAAVMLLVGSASAALAQGRLLDSYCAQISDNDKIASDGYPLTDAGSILRQDRANFHRFGMPDDLDQTDMSFASSKARANIPAMLDAGATARGVLKAIVGDYPFVCVDVYARAMTAFIVEPEGDPGYDDAGPAFPFNGRWDCEVAIFTFDAYVYNNGEEDMPIQEIQENTDGSYTLLFAGDYFITVGDFTPSSMTWLSGETGDSFSCTLLD
jgi:hypothetical protein